MEHYCTLFDDKYLPFGLALHASMMKHAQPFCLWVLCMNRSVEDHLRRLALPSVRLLSIEVCENDELRSARKNRSWTEFCWTVSPFIYEFVFRSDPEISRVTYLDSDIYFFGPPSVLLHEFERSGRHVLLTEHAFAPEYDSADINGRFCVQFMTFRNTSQSRDILREWQRNCIRDCSLSPERGVVGDQRYLDEWPAVHSDAIHILLQKRLALGPWNVDHFCRGGCNEAPVFFHFQSFRLISKRWARLCYCYKIGRPGRRLYEAYCAELARQIAVMDHMQIEVIPLPLWSEKRWLLKNIKRWFLNHLWISRIR